VVNPVMPCERNLTDEVGDRRAPKEMIWLYIVRLDSVIGWPSELRSVDHLLFFAWRLCACVRWNFFA